MKTPISNIEPLQPEHIPSTFIDRENTKEALDNLLGENSSRNIHIQGPRGTGKTHLTISTLNQLSNDINTCYIDCRKHDTQYKALKQILQSLTNEQIQSGYHTSDLQRRLENKTGAIHTVIVLDEIDFLLHNDGEDLLYHLSRTHTAETNIITISSQLETVQNQIEERTFSSLQPYPLQTEPYTGEETYQILRRRAQKALKPQTLHKEALTYIASTTQNIRLALQWLKTSAKTTESAIITENQIQETQEKARQQYTSQLLNHFTEHHHLLHQAIKELDTEQDQIQAGDIYQRYQQVTQSYNQDQLSDRRISDYLKHLDYLDLIHADYHYGGKTGKTRTIDLYLGT